MSEVEYATEVGTVDSIVLGAAENEARMQGFSISADAKDYLITHVRRGLDEALEGGELETRREEIEGNTKQLMELVHELHLRRSPDDFELDADSFRSALFSICGRYPDFFPFCRR